MNNLFKDCRNWDEAKTLFRKLRRCTPDLGGTHEKFIELEKQFENFTPTVKITSPSLTQVCRYN